MERILVIRLGRLGDMVMISPAMRAILRRHGSAQVHLLTSPEGREALQGFDPRITETIVYDRRGVGQAIRRRRLQRSLVAAEYHRVYCFETNPSIHALLKPVRGEKRLLHMTDEVIPYPERCLQLVGGDLLDSPWVSLPVTPTGRAAANVILAGAGVASTDFVVGLHTTFSTLGKLSWRGRDSRRRRTWPVTSFARIARLLVEEGEKRGISVRLVCALMPQFRQHGLELVERSAGSVTLFAGPPDFERYKAMVERMNLMITPDTGPMHIAAAVGTPVVALFSGSDPRDCGPYTDPASYVALCAEERGQAPRGIAAISPERVFEACRRFLPT